MSGISSCSVRSTTLQAQASQSKRLRSGPYSGSPSIILIQSRSGYVLYMDFSRISRPRRRGKFRSLAVWFLLDLILLAFSSVWVYVGLFAESGFPLAFVKWPVGPLAPGISRSPEILWSGLALDFVFWGVVSLAIVLVTRRVSRR